MKLKNYIWKYKKNKNANKINNLLYTKNELINKKLKLSELLIAYSNIMNHNNKKPIIRRHDYYDSNSNSFISGKEKKNHLLLKMILFSKFKRTGYKRSKYRKEKKYIKSQKIKNLKIKQKKKKKKLQI